MTSESPKGWQFPKRLFEIITGWKYPDSQPEKNRNEIILLDRTPTGQEEEEMLFDNPVDDQADLNERIARAERIQDMGERKKFADRAFIVTKRWISFLIILPFVQMIFSIWGIGLSDAQFVTVVTSTTAAVFGFWMLVGRYLFPRKKDFK